MRINPIPSPESVAPSSTEPQLSRVQTMRSLKMNTNATPSYLEAPMEMNQNPPTEGVPEQTDEAAEATQPLSPQMAALAKHRRALQVKERELEAREKALSSQTGQSNVITKDQLKADPLRILLDSGVTYDDLADHILNNGGNSEINALKAELEALKSGMDERFSEKVKQEEKQALAEMRRYADQLLASGDEFELVKGMGRQDDVITLIERTYRETGEVLDVKEALQLVEDELFQDVQKLANFKKVQSQFIPQAQQQMQRQQPGMRTLTNRDTASVPLNAKARALAAFHGTLKR